jgi:D-amino peptidase
MESLAGVVNQGQLFPGSLDYQHFREIMTGEALAAVEGARAGGATEIVVSDCHLNADNLLVDRFPGDVRVIRGWPRRQFHLAGLDSSFQAVALIGFHAPGHSASGVRAHTFTSAHFTHVSLNGTPVSEAVFNAAVAGHHGVPVVMISGDDVAIADARATLGDIEAAETKHALGFSFGGVAVTRSSPCPHRRSAQARTRTHRRLSSPCDRDANHGGSRVPELSPARVARVFPRH